MTPILVGGDLKLAILVSREMIPELHPRLTSGGQFETSFPVRPPSCGWKTACFLENVFAETVTINAMLALDTS